MTRRTSRLLALMVCVCMLLMSVISGPIANAAVQSGVSDTSGESTIQAPQDIKGHWAEKIIMNWMQKGLIRGYSDKTVKPNNSITRAEFITMVNNTFGYKEIGGNKYKDVASSEWFANEVAKASSIGYVAGYEDGTIRPNNKITRQEVAVVISKILSYDLVTDSNIFSQFNDSNDIAPWAKGQFGAVIANKIISGYNDQTCKPTNPITRAETVAILTKVAGELYNVAGEFGQEGEAKTLEGNVTISTSDVTLKNTIIKGNLYLTEGIGNGNITLDTVTVEGRTLVRGGGMNSFVIKNTSLGLTIINKKTGDVRILAQGNSNVKSITLRSGCKLEENGNSKEDGFTGFGDVNIDVDVPAGETIQFEGDFGDVNVAGSQLKVELLSGSIGKLDMNKDTKDNGFKVIDGQVNELVLNSKTDVNVENGKIDSITAAEGSKGSEINVGTEGVVGYLDANVELNVTGDGKLQTLDAKVDGVVTEKTPENILVGKDVSVTVGEENVTETVITNQDAIPTPKPTPGAEVTPVPTSVPAVPTAIPTAAPTVAPTAAPAAPSAPVVAATAAPTPAPTHAPSAKRTEFYTRTSFMGAFTTDFKAMYGGNYLTGYSLYYNGTLVATDSDNDGIIRAVSNVFTDISKVSIVENGNTRTDEDHVYTSW